MRGDRRGRRRGLFAAGGEEAEEVEVEVEVEPKAAAMEEEEEGVESRLRAAVDDDADGDENAPAFALLPAAEGSRRGATAPRMSSEVAREKTARSSSLPLSPVGLSNSDLSQDSAFFV